MNDNRCLFCGELVPEGRQVCPICEKRLTRAKGADNVSRQGRGWAKYGITRWRKREIMNFCRQYDDWRKELQYGLRAVNVESGGHSNNISRPTEQQAIRNDMLRTNILLVEHAIRDVCPQIFEEMLDNIARGVPYASLSVPYSQADFYSIRITVYALISERRGK